MKAWGVRCLVGASFARIFRRNAVNLGLPVLECAGAAGAARPGSQIRIDTDTGEVDVDGQVFRAQPGAGVRRRPRVLRRPRAVGQGAARGGVDVIVRDLGDAWQVVLQTDHADLCRAVRGELVGHRRACPSR